MAKVNIPKGTRDFLPGEVIKRKYLFDTIEHHFRLFGFVPIETPAMETTATLLGKYGEEGDRLIFKMMPRGEKAKKAMRTAMEAVDLGEERVLDQSAEEALRYDLTVPFARYVVQHQNEISFPFKRYQIQPVWRADRPQKGRYREFYQCDADIIGSNNLLNEVELIQLIQQVFTALKLTGVQVRINNRKILSGLAEVIGAADQLIPLTIAIDKLDKIGLEGVLNELRNQSFSTASIEQLRPLLQFSGNNEETLNQLDRLFVSSQIGQNGVAEVREVLRFFPVGTAAPKVDLTLARGLNYYTGAIFEVVHPDFPSSICGGGRYDDLTGIFGLKDVSGVGISFGADRIYDLLEQKGLFPDSINSSIDFMVLSMGEQHNAKAMKLVREARSFGICSMVYPDQVKMKKSMKYANQNNIPFVGILGDEEAANGTVTLKNMRNGAQEQVPVEKVAQRIKAHAI